MDGDLIAERLVRCLPAATFEMETLCRLAGVVATTTIPTAAVDCSLRPRLLINPEFVAKHCARDEHLFLLVMHELHHVLLAHTTLFPRVTREENIAFDAVINAMLTRQFDAPEYRGFFEAINPANRFPGCLLRPPRGWPKRGAVQGKGWPDGAAAIVDRLYPRGGGDAPLPTYAEILDLFDSPLAEGSGTPEPMLLGDHSPPGSRGNADDDPLAGELVRRIVARWPPPPFPLDGRDAGGAPQPWYAPRAPSADAARRAFAAVLRRALAPARGRATTRRRRRVPQSGGLGVLIDPRDRLAPARAALGVAAPLWTQVVPLAARMPDDPARAHVYLDVSGSMSTLLPRLVGLLVPWVARGEAAVFQFSTSVAPLSRAALAAGNLTTTFGTDITPVVRHMLDTPRCRRALLLTDGYVGEVSLPLRVDLALRGMRVHLVMPAESHFERDLAPIATSLTVLPPLDGADDTWRP